MSAILVVEQDPGYANRVVAALQAAGHEVKSASSRDEAEAAASAGSFDLVLANGMMPGAADLLGRFSKGSGGPGSVVLLPVTLASHTEASTYSADDVLSKPFSDEDLERVVSGRLSATPAASEPAAPELAAPGPAAPQPPQPAAPAPAPPEATAPEATAPEAAAATTTEPPAAQPPTPQPGPSAAKPPAAKPAAPKRPSAQQTVDSDIDDLLNKTLSGLDISSLTRKKPKPKAKPAAPSSQPAGSQPAAPQPTPTQPASQPPPQPKAPQPTAPQPPAVQPSPPAAEETPSQPPAAPSPSPPSAPASSSEPTAPQAAPQPPAKPQSKPVSLTSTDIFGDVLAEVEAESEKSRARAPEPAAPPAEPAAPTALPATPQPETPQPEAPQPAASQPAASPQPPRRSSYDDDLDRKLEETLSGVLPSRLRRKPGEKPPVPSAPPAAAASTPPPQDFAAPPAEAVAPEPPAEAPQPDLPVDFSEDETVSIVRPVSEPRESGESREQPSPPPRADAGEDLADDSEEPDFFATTLLPTQGEGEASTEVKPPADFVPRAETAAPASATPTSELPEPTAPEPASTPGFAADSGDEFDISFGESEPTQKEEGGNIWSAYGTEETAGWGTTSFEAQAPIASPEAEPPSAPASTPPESTAPDPQPTQAPPEAETAPPPEAEPAQEAEPDAGLDSTGWGSDSVWEVPSFVEEGTDSEVEPPSFGSEDPGAAEATESRAEESDEPSFQPPTFEAGPSLGEDPELDFSSSDFVPTGAAGADSAPDAAPAPPAPTTESAPADATGSLDELSTELGGDDTGSFHTALQGVLQIRGDDGDGAKGDDQGVPFGDYRLLERVAVGGMAEVWRARRRGVEGFQKTVAIKRILSHLTGSTDFINMFIDEAKLAAQLNHANIAQIYDLGKVDDDFYIAMEFVEGRDLRTLLRESKQKDRPLPMGQTLFIVAAVARALDYAHRKRDFEDRDLGLVHRDVSPQNVLVSTEGEIKLCDFGIVKAVAKASTTQMGALKGKLQYMSPEQAWGKEVDGRSDVFSLGTVMFEALTGEKLFTGDSEIGVLDAVRDCRIKSARAIDPTLPESVEAILSKTLTGTPEERYQTAGEMERDIQSVLETLKPSPGQSDLARYMHELLEAPAPGAPGPGTAGTGEDDESAHAEDSSAAGGVVGADEDGTAWTGTSWGTASFTEDEAEASEPVSAKIPLATTEPVSSKPPEPATSAPPAMSSSKVPVPEKKGGGKLIWILLILTMLAIIAAVAWTRLGGGESGESDVPATGAPPVATPADAQPADGDATGEGAVEGEAGDGEAEAEDPEAIMQQMLQEEMERKKQEMEEQFEAQKREIERRLKEVEGEDGG